MRQQLVPTQVPSKELLFNIISRCADLHGENAFEILNGVPDRRARHLSYWVLRRLFPRLPRSMAARSVGARDIYVQVRMAALYAKVIGPHVRLWVEGIAAELRPTRGHRHALKRAAVAPRIASEEPCALRPSSGAEPTIAELCRPLSAHKQSRYHIAWSPHGLEQESCR